MAQSQDPAMTQSAGADGQETQDTNEAEDQAGSTIIEIVIALDGSITVEQETGEQEAAENGGTEPAESAPVQVKNIEQALEVVRQMYNATQQSPEEQKASTLAQQKQGYTQP